MLKRTGGSAPKGESPSRLIDGRIAELGDWRGATLAGLRALIHEADPAVVEEWKWGGPVFSHGGILCTGETYKNVVKLTFARGALVKEPEEALQLEPRGERAPRDRLPRRGDDRRGRVPGPDPRGGCGQRGLRPRRARWHPRHWSCGTSVSARCGRS